MKTGIRSPGSASWLPGAMPDAYSQHLQGRWLAVQLSGIHYIWDIVDKFAVWDCFSAVIFVFGTLWHKIFRRKLVIDLAFHFCTLLVLAVTYTSSANAANPDFPNT